MFVKSRFQFFSIRSGEIEGNSWAQITLVDDDHQIWELRVPKNLVTAFRTACESIGYLDMVEAELSINPFKGKEGKTMYNVRLEDIRAL